MPEDIDEKTFEQSMAELAINSLKTKVPALMDYALAFQMVERSDDDTRAVGFFGFKVGENLIYVPVFFLGGEIKGTELCYVVEEDRFVPLDEGWVNQIIRRKTFSIGETASRSRNEQGITGPDLRRLRVPPMEAKISSDQSWNRFGKQMFESMTKLADVAIPHLPEVLARHGIVESFLIQCKAQPKLANAVFTFYTPENFIDAFVKEGKRKKKTDFGEPIVYKRPVNIFDGNDAIDNPVDLGFLSEDEKKQVLKGNVVVVDGRTKEEKKKVYNAEVTKNLCNPTAGGCYDVLTAAGEASKMFVMLPQTIGSGGTHDIRVVLNDKGEYMFAPTTSIWVVKQYELKECLEELSKFGNALSSQDTWDKDSADGYIVVSADGGHAIGPFTVDEVISNSDGTTTLFVKAETPRLEGTKDKIQAGQDRDRRGLPFDGVLFTDDGALNLSDGNESNNYPYRSYSCGYDDIRRIIITDKPLKRAVKSRGVLLVPKNGGFRVVKLTKKMHDANSPSSTADMYMKINKFAEDLEATKESLGIRIKTESLEKVAINKKEAYETLLLDIGIGKEDADIIIKQAEDNPNKKQRFLVDRQTEKLAAPPFDHPDFDAHMDPMFSAPVQQGGISLMNLLPEHQSFDAGASQQYRHFKDENDASTLYQKDISNLDNAAQSGQQDVFDASAIGALVNVGDIDSELADYIPHLLRALDKLGRTLFLLHWHSEEMQDKYGKTEARDMEEDIKNVFENLGDVVLDMKKSVPNSDDLFGAGIMGDGSQN